jgi:hypothetical protein
MNDLKDQLIDALSQQIGLLSAQNTYLNLLVKSFQAPAPADVKTSDTQPVQQPQHVEAIGTPTANDDTQVESLT